MSETTRACFTLLKAVSDVMQDRNSDLRLDKDMYCSPHLFFSAYTDNHICYIGFLLFARRDCEVIKCRCHKFTAMIHIFRQYSFFCWCPSQKVSYLFNSCMFYLFNIISFMSKMHKFIYSIMHKFHVVNSRFDFFLKSEFANEKKVHAHCIMETRWSNTLCNNFHV